MSGARFVALKGQLARLERALGQFMLDIQTREHGYLEVSPPLLVRDEAVFGTGQLPKFAEDLFRTTDERWLIPTAEVSLTNLVREPITDEAELPLRLDRASPLLPLGGRRVGPRHARHDPPAPVLEGRAGVDHHARPVRGRARAHGRHSAEAVLKRLELPFRTMLLCTGRHGLLGPQDLRPRGLAAEPGRPIARSAPVSNCGDFQARRMDARCKAAGDKGARYVHTLNGSGPGRRPDPGGDPGELPGRGRPHRHPAGPAALPARRDAPRGLMRILLTNDDGIGAEGLEALGRIAAALSDDVWICAPEQEQSGASRALTLSHAGAGAQARPAPLRRLRHARPTACAWP